jgi:hypothetical protein
MEYSGSLPKLCPNGDSKSGQINWGLILAVILVLGVVAGSYWGYNKYVSKRNEEEKLLVDVTRVGARSNPGNRVRLQPLPYRCPYNTY